jgi:tight adherence protein C
MNLLAQDPVRIGGVLILVAALVLSLAGMGLLLYSARMTREAVSKRVDLIRPNEGPQPQHVALGAMLIRSGARGLEEREKRETTKVLARFGVPAARADATLTGIRLALVGLLAIVAFILASRWSLTSRAPAMPMLLAAAFGIVGWFLPGMLIGRMIKARAKAIVAGLPDALELLVICVEAGLSFEDGIDRISGVLQKSQPALSEELALTSADMKILPSRDEALANLAVRVNMPSVRSVVTTLSQTLRYGTPLAQALRVVAGELRNDTLMRLEERANQLPSLMTIPMMLFIMPTIFMIVAGPAVLRVMDIMHHR